MRVKLSYTVSDEDVLKESAKILGLAADDMQQCIALFQETQKELHGVEDAVPNSSKAVEMLAELREALLAVDTRAAEVIEIVNGYLDYQRGGHLGDGEADMVSPGSPAGTSE
jgi:hypothetical protein